MISLWKWIDDDFPMKMDWWWFPYENGLMIISLWKWIDDDWWPCGFVWKCWVNLPNEIAIFHRDNDQQNHWVLGTDHYPIILLSILIIAILYIHINVGNRPFFHGTNVASVGSTGFCASARAMKAAGIPRPPKKPKLQKARPWRRQRLLSWVYGL